jgi:N-acetylmuramate 1-kinase
VVGALSGRPVEEPRLVEFLREWTETGSGVPAVVPLEGDASTRRYYRIGGPGRTSILALYTEPFAPEAMPFLEVHGLMAAWGLPVPGVLSVDGPRGIILQEDLGDVTLQQALATATADEREALYRQALGQLTLLQDAAARGSSAADCFRVAFDIEKLTWELHYFLKHFVEGLRGRDLSVEDRATLSEAFHRLAEEMASWPRVLCHRDLHSRNLMLHRGELRWIDFQDARRGPATYDLASLLRDSYVDLDEEFVADRAEEFREAALRGEARDVFRRRFELTSVQRNLKALGTFGYMTVVRGKTFYEQYVTRTLAMARRNLVKYPELTSLHRVLARHVEELS